MDILLQLVDFILHVDRYLEAFVAQYGAWVYALLFLIIFVETGVVVMPFLPGDSLLFIVGAMCGAGLMSLPLVMGLLLVAAILGDQTTIILARFMPFVRTFVPFVAGVAEMTRSKFTFFNVVGAVIWVVGLLSVGYLFGNLPIVQQHLSKIIWALIIVPGLIALFGAWKARQAA
jgi:membrane-associated protein